MSYVTDDATRFLVYRTTAPGQVTASLPRPDGKMHDVSFPVPEGAIIWEAGSDDEKGMSIVDDHGAIAPKGARLRKGVNDAPFHEFLNLPLVPVLPSEVDGPLRIKIRRAAEANGLPFR